MASLASGTVVLFLRDDGNVPAHVTLSTLGPEDVSFSNTGAAEVELKVDVSKAVRNPEVYALGPNDRLFDALAAAGGPTGDAQLAAVNQSMQV